MYSAIKPIAIAGALLALSAAGAEARTNISVGIGVPGPVYYDRAPVYYEPAPVYVEPAPVYYEARPVYRRYPVAYYNGRDRHRYYDWDRWDDHGRYRH